LATIKRYCRKVDIRFTLTRNTGALQSQKLSTGRSFTTSKLTQDEDRGADVCNHKAPGNTAAMTEKTRRILRSQQEEVERKRNVIIQQQRDILGQKQVEAARIETVDWNREALCQKVNSYDIELSKVLSKEQEQQKNNNDLQRLMEECKNKITTIQEEMQIASQISSAREKDLKKKETRLKEVTSTLRALNDSILSVEDKISKCQSRRLSLKRQRENLARRIARTKNASPARASRMLVQLEDLLITIEDDIQVIGAKTSELLAHHQSLIDERKSQESRHYDILETVLSLRNIVRDAKNRHITLSKNLRTIQKQRDILQAKLSQQKALLVNLKKQIVKLSSDHEAVKKALEQLSQRKTSLITVFYKIMKEESELHRKLSALQKSHRILGERIGMTSETTDQQEKQGASEFKVCTAKVTRHKNDRKCQGTLIVSRCDIKFLPADSSKEDLLGLNLPLTHVLGAQINYLRNVPELSISLDPDIETYSSHDLRFTNESENLKKICEFLNSKNNISEQREVKVEQSLLGKLPSHPIEPEIVGESTILNLCTFKKLIMKCPKQVMLFPWKLQYSLVKHGSSMYAFYERLKGCQFTMMLIKDTTQSVFGAFLCEEWHSCDKHYGKMDTFVFREKDGDVEVWSTTEDDSFYQYSGENIFVGVKDRSAIWLSNNFVNGNTNPCPTFGSPSLKEDNENTEAFQVLLLEIWAPSYDF